MKKVNQPKNTPKKFHAVNKIHSKRKTRWKFVYYTKQEESHTHGPKEFKLILSTRFLQKKVHALICACRDRDLHQGQTLKIIKYFKKP